jgi:hypothetical protein
MVQLTGCCFFSLYFFPFRFLCFMCMMIDICQFGIFTPTSFIKLRCWFLLEHSSLSPLRALSIQILYCAEAHSCRFTLSHERKETDCSGVQVKGTRTLCLPSIEASLPMLVGLLDARHDLASFRLSLEIALPRS